MAAAVSWPLLWVVQLATDTQLEAEAQVRKLEELLSLEKVFSTTLLASRLAHKVGEQNNVETLACHFAKLGGHQLL